MIYLEQVERIWRDIQMVGDCLSLKELKISGKDLIQDGMKPGPQVGEILDELLRQVLENPLKNERESLLCEARRLREKEGAQ